MGETMFKRFLKAVHGNILLKVNGKSSDDIYGLDFNPYKKPIENKLNKDELNLDKTILNDECPYVLKDFNGEFKDEYYFEYNIALSRLQVRQSMFPNSNFQIVDNQKEK